MKNSIKSFHKSVQSITLLLLRCLAIETYLPNAKTFSILTIIECKNLGRKVPIGKIDDFEAKLRQIAGELK